jgi:HEAT repeat protein
MPVTMQQVLASLWPDEPNYDAAKGLGPEALPHLAAIALGADLMLASKAVYLTGVIGGREAARILMEAAGNREVILRAAAAGALAHVRDIAYVPVLIRLLGDDNTDVRRVAIQSVPPELMPEIRGVLEKMAESDTDPSIRDLAKAALYGTQRPSY